MGDPLVHQLRQCCLQVMGECPGCGFFIAPHLIITCAHVVGPDTPIGSEIPLHQWGDATITPLSSTLIALFPTEDIAVLETPNPGPTFAPFSAEVRLDQRLTALGFPLKGNQPTFDQITGRYEAQTQFAQGDSILTAAIKFKKGQVEPGYSGGPLLNLDTGRVIGVVSYTRSPDQALGGFAVAVPEITALLATSGIQLPAVDPRWTDAEARQQQGSGLIQLTPEQLRALVQSPDTGQVEALSQQLGQSQTAIRNALRSLGAQEHQIADENLPQKLLESIQAFERQLQTVAVLRSDNAEVNAQIRQAQSALEAEDPDSADNAFAAAAELALAQVNEAEALEAQARAIREQRQMEAAAALAQRGDLAMARLAYRNAAQHFAQAAELCPRPEQATAYRDQQMEALYEQGKDQGDNAALEEAIDLYRAKLASPDQTADGLAWAMTQNNLGNALWRLGARESGTARLEEAVAAYRAALAERTRERVPLDWAMTQNNLGNALSTLGERESDTVRLDEALVAYRAALEERTRERVPLEWAATQTNLGLVLSTLGARESGMVRLEEAAAAYRAALTEQTRERVPLEWAVTQNNLGLVLKTLGERESGTVRLEEAVAAFRAALAERTRQRVPLEWAATQNNLGVVLWRLGERESGTVRLEEAVAAYRAALEEHTRQRVPLSWATDPK
jgi:tetratricopeptide (TPR) repeat protein